jgi:hypothetical protein
VIYCGGFEKLYTTKKRFFDLPTLNYYKQSSFGGWGFYILYQLKAVENRAVRVYMAARSRVARRVASTVWPCRLAVKQRRYISPLAPLRPDRPRRFNGKFTRLRTN